LGYIKGGFQSLIEYIEKKDKKLGVVIKNNYEITNISQGKTGFVIDKEQYDGVISTLPSPVLAKVAQKILPSTYIDRTLKLNYLHARVLVIETDNTLLDETYWLNICTEKIPLMLLAQHTNFVDKKHYNNHHIAYVGYYLEREDNLMKMSEKDFKEEVLGSLRKFIKKEYKVINTYEFIGPFAQPIFDTTFVQNMPEFRTPVSHFYIANLDMTYPYDRGTNYAVKLGREVASIASEGDLR
jgi:protoporphyrinogen oxidase